MNNRALLSSLNPAGLTADSRKVRPGWLFAALPGLQHDGASFIADAVRAGAIAVLAAPDAAAGLRLPDNVLLITDPDPRRRLAQLAALHYGPAPDNIALVTGTDGKSSTVDFARQIWRHLGYSAATVGTLGVVLDDEAGFASGGLTTPDPVTLQQTLAKLRQDGVTHAAIEASSHGLDMRRLDGLRPFAAGLTHISRDHLDYHKTPEAYRAAKLRLFTEVLPAGGTAVTHGGIPETRNIAAIAAERNLRLLTYGVDVAGADIHCRRATAQPNGFEIDLSVTAVELTLYAPLIGRFQLENALCALGLVIAGGEDPRRAAAMLEKLRSVPGRMQPVAGNGPGARVYVDYAHTPNALETALRALRAHVPGKLHVLFGCGGDRDTGKRPQMGRVAAEFADSVIVTDDNPRSEAPGAIRAQILAACPQGREVPDRRRAIEAALDSLGLDDALLLAGKGHEREQIIGDRRLPFDDAAVARALIGDADKAQAS